MATSKKSAKSTTKKASIKQSINTNNIPSIIKPTAENLPIGGKILQSLKNIRPIHLILIFIVLSGVFYFLVSPINQYKLENKRLSEEIINIQKQREELKDTIISLQSNYIKLEDSASIKKELIEQINQRISSIESNIYNSFMKLEQIKSSVTNINDQIKKTKENPVKRVGDDLIKSLESKINK